VRPLSEVGESGHCIHAVMSVFDRPMPRRSARRIFRATARAENGRAVTNRPVANWSICGEPDTASNNLQRMAPRLLLVTNQLESSGPDPGDHREMGRDRGRVLGVRV